MTHYQKRAGESDAGKVVECQTSPKYPDLSFGEITDGHVTIRGPIIHSKLEPGGTVLHFPFDSDSSQRGSISNFEPSSDSKTAPSLETTYELRTTFDAQTTSDAGTTSDSPNSRYSAD